MTTISADLELAPIVEPEQFVRVAVLLVVVDQTGIRRRGQHAVVTARQLLLAHVAVDDRGGTAACADARKLLQPCEGVECVTAQELRCRLNGTTLTSVLVTPVGLELRLTRRLEIEVGRATRGSGRAGEDDTQHVNMLVLVDESPEAEQLASGLRPEPPPNVCRGTIRRDFSDAGVRCPQLLFQDERVVRASLDLHQ